MKRNIVKTSWHALVVLTLIAIATTASAANKLTDNFDKENGGVAQLNYAKFRHFRVTSGEVDLIGNGTNDPLPWQRSIR